jgi:endonuclease/exonuclease/phosphatase (EEP) superfamily protein YafD
LELAKTVFEVTGYLITVFTLIPLIRYDNWFFRIFEYPRLQKLAAALFLTGCYIALFRIDSLREYLFLGVSALMLGYLFYQILPFTPFTRLQLITSRSLEEDDRIKLFIANVYQYNVLTEKCLDLLKKSDPDVIMLVETNKFWTDRLAVLEKDYKYQVKVPLENTYGMVLYSKLELIDSQIKFLVDNDVPSIHTKIKLVSGKIIRLYCLHPTPPVPQENPRSTERDKELLLVAEEAKNIKDPVIVAGDLNDVAWSYTTDLFSKVSGLLDPRKGRGFYNTFHAKYFFLRFPLDHVFCSTDFTLVSLERMPHIGSDHFPILIELQYEKQAKHKQEEPRANAGEKEIADEKVHADTSRSSN